MRLWRERPGTIDVRPCWCCYSQGYFYSAPTLTKLLWKLLREWKSSKHLLG